MIQQSVLQSHSLSVCLSDSQLFSCQLFSQFWSKSWWLHNVWQFCQLVCAFLRKKNTYSFLLALALLQPRRLQQKENIARKLLKSWQQVPYLARSLVTCYTKVTSFLVFFFTCNIICTQTFKNTDVSIFKGTIIGIRKPTSSNIKFKFLVMNNDNQIFKFYYLFQFVLKN